MSERYFVEEMDDIIASLKNSISIFNQIGEDAKKASQHGKVPIESSDGIHKLIHFFLELKEELDTLNEGYDELWSLFVKRERDRLDAEAGEIAATHALNRSLEANVALQKELDEANGDWQHLQGHLDAMQRDRDSLLIQVQEQNSAVSPTAASKDLHDR